MKAKINVSSDASIPTSVEVFLKKHDKSAAKLERRMQRARALRRNCIPQEINSLAQWM
jgi:hypothetical protein